ncbi:MAG: hypothetical protein ABJI96_03605 [Paracoccaceae bacterium]
MTRNFALSALIVAGCTPINGEANLVDGRTAARFTERPTHLFAALEETCTRPADTFVRKGPDLMQCRTYLPPEPTAAIILNYDGTIKDLPELVVQLSGQSDADSYVLENSYFLNVPQLGGSTLHVRQGDRRVERRMNSLMRAAGGTPL